jgi:hypothetical protein
MSCNKSIECKENIGLNCMKNQEFKNKICICLDSKYWNESFCGNLNFFFKFILKLKKRPCLIAKNFFLLESRVNYNEKCTELSMCVSKKGLNCLEKKCEFVFYNCVITFVLLFYFKL